MYGQIAPDTPFTEKVYLSLFSIAYIDVAQKCITSVHSVVWWPAWGKSDCVDYIVHVLEFVLSTEGK